MLSYLPKNKARHEFVTVLPNGFRFRGIIHRTLNQLLAWFKEHFRDPIPGTIRFIIKLSVILLINYYFQV